MHPVLLPHKFFGCLFKHRRDVWDTSVRGPIGAALGFWQALERQGSSIVRDHPALDQARLAQTVPIGLHGDGGAFSKQDSLFVISWNSISSFLGSSGFTQRFPFTIVRKGEMAPSTLDELFRVFAWSVNVLLTGITPDRDWDGKPLSGGCEYIAAGWRAALVQVRGDWEFYANTLGFPNWATGVNMCWLCAASNTIARLSWTNFGDDAGWRSTRRSHASYSREMEGRGGVPLILKLCIGLTLGCVMVAEWKKDASPAASISNAEAVASALETVGDG